MVKTAGFQVINPLRDFVWNQNIKLPVGLMRGYMEGLQFLPQKENLIDRLVHRSHIVICFGEGCRLTQSMNCQRPGIQ